MQFKLKAEPRQQWKVVPKVQPKLLASNVLRAVLLSLVSFIRLQKAIKREEECDEIKNKSLFKTHTGTSNEGQKIIHTTKL